ncbi:MAG: RHS repeat-associated core domain-containing protein [Deltaproteobacteria bacterium]|nr:RHS repeat-associated core domain-containing protein [Deltaproteobacteria bacterium]
MTYNLRFPGQYFDSETGLYYNMVRDYNPALGRYVQSDPIGLLGGVNTYGYVDGNPVNWVDHYGLWEWGDPPPQGVVDFSSGMGDVLSFGLTDWARDQMGTNGVVNKCSGSYSAGEWTGFGVSLATGVAGGLEAAGTKAAGKEFSHWIPKRMGGPRSILNGNYVTAEEHALSDTYRYRFMPRDWKEANPLLNPLTQQWNRIPNVYKGGAAGAGYGAAGMDNSACGCQ